MNPGDSEDLRGVPYLEDPEDVPGRNGIFQHMQNYHVSITIAGYTCCSSLLLIVNKHVLQVFSAPALLLVVQCVFAVSLLWFSRSTYISGEPQTVLHASEKKTFYVVVLAFTVTLFSSMKSLQYSNVDTIVCLRMTMPLWLSVLDYMFLNRELPSFRSKCALIGVACSFSLFFLSSKPLDSTAMVWLFIWYTSLLFETIFVKHVVSSSKLDNASLSFYQNLFSIPSFICVAVFIGDIRKLRETSWNVQDLIILFVSCFLGLGMSYLSFSLRRQISATSFSMVGNGCKLFTILMNFLIWDKHASSMGTYSVFLAIIFGVFYEQAPVRRSLVTSSDNTSSSQSCRPGTYFASVFERHSNCTSHTFRLTSLVLLVVSISLPVLVITDTRGLFSVAKEHEPACAGPFVWDISQRREGFGSNFGRRSSSFALANYLNARWIGNIVNSHGGQDGAPFLGLISNDCSPETLKRQIELGTLHAYNVSQTFVDSRNCSIYDSSSQFFYAKRITEKHHRIVVWIFDIASDNERRQFISQMRKCLGNISIVSPIMRSRYTTLRNQRGFNKTANEFRITLYFRWGDVGKGKNLTAPTKYNKRTGGVALSTLSRYQHFVHDIIEVYAAFNSQSFTQYNVSCHFFSEGLESEFSEAFSVARKGTQFHIGGSWQDAFDLMTTSDLIIAGTRHETFIGAITRYCDSCKLVVGGDTLAALVKKWQIKP